MRVLEEEAAEEGGGSGARWSVGLSEWLRDVSALAGATSGQGVGLSGEEAVGDSDRCGGGIVTGSGSAIGI